MKKNQVLVGIVVFFIVVFLLLMFSRVSGFTECDSTKTFANGFRCYNSDGTTINLSIKSCDTCNKANGYWKKLLMKKSLGNT